MLTETTPTPSDDEHAPPLADLEHRPADRSSILAVLRQANEALGPRDIAAATGAVEVKVRQSLVRMLAKGEVAKEARGLYRIPDEAPPTAAPSGSGPRKGRRGSQRYADTMIAFTPRSMAEQFRSTVGQIKLGPYPDKTGWSDAFACHIGAAEITLHCPTKGQINELVLRDFHLLVAEHGMDVVATHNALSDLIEFRRAIHASAYGSIAQGKPRDTNAAPRKL